MLVFLTPSPLITPRLGEETSIGLTAGRGRDGAGEADRLMDGDDPNEDRRLCETGGGSMGRGVAMGVPGFEGAGEPTSCALPALDVDRGPMSGGAGLLEDILRLGRSIL